MNKSLQDRLRRDRISRSVKQLKELILGPSIEHAKVGKADILKLTVQYIRDLKQKELTGNASECPKLKETCSGELNVNSIGNKPSPCLAHPRLQRAERNRQGVGTEWENFMAFRHKKIMSKENLSFTKLLDYPSHFPVTQNASSTPRPKSEYQKRAPFHELNNNSQQVNDKQTIWRPW